MHAGQASLLWPRSLSRALLASHTAQPDSGPRVRRSAAASRHEFGRLRPNSQATRSVVRPEKDNIERLKQALRTLFDDPCVDEIDAEELVGPYPALEYVPPHGRYSMDILTRLGEAFRYEELEYEELRIDDFTMRVATPGMLYRMKKDTVRPQDRADAARIREAFDLPEE